MGALRLAILAGMVLTFAAGGALAQEKVDEKRPASEDGVVEIHNRNGSIEVVGWSRREVAVTGTLGSGAEGLEFSVDSHRTTVRVMVPKDAKDVGASHLKVQVPEDSQVEVETVGSDIEVGKVVGVLYLQSVGGGILVKDRPWEVNAKSVGGRIEISVAGSRVKAESVGGQVTLNGTTGEADVSTVSGEILVKGGRFERGRFKTVSGDVRFDGGVARNGVFDFSSHSGSIEMLLPGYINADFRITTFSGEIENAFGPVAYLTEKHTGRKRLAFSTGPEAAPADPVRRIARPGNPLKYSIRSERAHTGRARITMDSFSGTVKLKKK